MRCGLKGYTLRFLRETGFRPRKRLGQSFLVDCRVAKAVARAAGQGEVYEIGTGIGALTFYLSKTCSYVRGIEIDERLARYLHDNLALPNLDLFVGDALLHVPPGSLETVVSSVPYSISSPLIVHLCHNIDFRRAVLILQEEFARRLLAEPGSHDYGRLSVLSQLCFTIKPMFRISRESFLPRPRVDSHALVLEKKATNNLNLVEEITRRLFTYRRRRLSAAFKKAFPGVRPPPGLAEKRVYQLSPEEIVKITEYIGGAT